MQIVIRASRSQSQSEMHERKNAKYVPAQNDSQSTSGETAGLQAAHVSVHPVVFAVFNAARSRVKQGRHDSAFT